MSSTTIAALRTAAQQVTIYLNITNVIAGVLGNSLNILVFLSLKTFRETTCAFYLIVMSFVNIGQLLTGALSRVLISGFNNDLTSGSVPYCKIRIYLLQVFGLSSFTLLCLATIDQYLATCTRPRWQSWSNMRAVRFLNIITIVFWMFYNIPYLILYNLQSSSMFPNPMCVNTNPQFDRYHTYFQRFVLQGFLPNVITIVFGCLTHWNLQSLAYRTVPLVRRESDKQLSTMLLVQVIFNIFALLLFNIISIISPYVYGIANPTSSAVMQFIDILSFCFYYSYFACPFYIYICVSERFRRQLAYVFLVKHLTRCRKTRVANGNPNGLTTTS